MSRGRYSIRVYCVHDGCRETTFFEAESRKEERSIRERHSSKWKCTRHIDPDGVLSPTNPRRVTEITSERHPDLPGLFWTTGSGFAHGQGWRAWADDFPPGTRIRVTAEVLLPVSQGGSTEGEG